MLPFDPRLTPARPDLAAAHLHGSVEAARFVEGTPYRVVWPNAPVKASPAPDASLTTEALFGETVTIYETTEEGWAWGQLDADGYVGWLPAEALGAPGLPATHKVTALRTLVFPGPGIKLPATAALSLGSRITVTGERGRFLVTDTGGYVFAGHLAPLDACEDDFVTVAGRFIGAPYIWGGRSSLGLDCSGLVQTALNACGVECPRDSDMQEAALGETIPFTGDLAILRRGDLIFWPGHVAIVDDGDTLLHANAHYMATVREPLGPALARIEQASAPVRTVKRLKAQ